MEKSISLPITLFVMAVVIATVMSFGGGEDGMGSFGWDNNYDRKYQNWLDKRGMGQSYEGFGRPLGNAGRYFNWKDYLANGISKRQLNYGPRSFGNFQRYFTNGLQDWRSTYTGIKKREVAAKQSSESDA